MGSRSKSTLFLIEQLIVIAVFAICSAACIRILTSAYFFAIDSRELSRALLAAESGAECYKAAAGDVFIVAELLGGVSGNADGAEAAFIYYDRNWRVSGESDAQYILRIINVNSDYLPSSHVSGDLSVIKLDGDEILSFAVAAADIFQRGDVR